MAYYAVTITATVIFAVLGWLVWLKTRSAAFALGFALIYFWTLSGAWSVIRTRLGGGAQPAWEYILDKLFYVDLDSDYLWSLVLYGFFVLVIPITVLLATRPGRATDEDRSHPLEISHVAIIAVAAVAGFASYVLIRPLVLQALSLDTSIYYAMRGALGTGVRYFTVHQELNRLALGPAAIGVAVLLSGERPKYLAGRGRTVHLVGYTVVIGGMFAFVAILGGKNELLYATIMGMLFYLVNARRPRYGWLGVTGVVALGLFALIDAIRGLPLLGLVGKISFSEALAALSAVAGSNERVAAHFSMYGALHFGVPHTHGSSLVWLAASVIPRAVWPGRPPSIYEYYAQQVNAVESQGYTIHHATGWYLNFGIVGMVLGGILLGCAWALCYNAMQSHPARQSRAGRVLRALSLSTVTAALPALLRAGPEAYKALLIDGLVIPTVVITFAAWFAAWVRRTAGARTGESAVRLAGPPFGQPSHTQRSGRESR